jgi:hypothetical protein
VLGWSALPLRLFGWEGATRPLNGAMGISWHIIAWFSSVVGLLGDARGAVRRLLCYNSPVLVRQTGKSRLGAGSEEARKHALLELWPARCWRALPPLWRSAGASRARHAASGTASAAR